MDFVAHDTQSAPQEAAELLSQSQEEMGFIPNMYRHMADAPPLLKAYKQMSQLFSQTSLSEAEQQVVLLAASVENRCDFCTKAHSKMAAGAGRHLAVRLGAKVAAVLDAGGQQHHLLLGLRQAGLREQLGHLLVGLQQRRRIGHVPVHIGDEPHLFLRLAQQFGRLLRRRLRVVRDKIHEWLRCVRPRGAAKWSPSLESPFRPCGSA